MFKKNHNPVALRELSPLSVAKLYIQANIDQDYDPAYELYTKRKDRIMWTKEENRVHSMDTDPAAYLKRLSWIMNGKFVKTSDITGYISFNNENGPQGFQMVKDENGIWKVSFMPIQ